MQFIKRSDCPTLLSNNQVQWTAHWVAHYRWQKDNSATSIQPSKPTDSYWLKDEIRIPLIEDFHNNCGYCGEAIPTLQDEQVGKGDVEHFLPKSIYPEQVYEWTNYIWSCKSCNQQKSHKETKKSYSRNYLNPCCKEDCANLVFIEDTGRYELSDVVSNDDYWKKRLRNTELKTMLNADELCRKRQLKISSLRQNFESIARFLPLLSNSAENVSPILQQINDSHAQILALVDSPDFYYLLQNQYQVLLQNYPQIGSYMDSSLSITNEKLITNVI